MRWMALACVAVCLLGGCNGGQEKTTTPPTTTSQALGGLDRLVAEANRTERLLEERVKALTEADSLSDVASELDDVVTELREGAGRLQDLELSSELDAPRDGLARALRSLADTLENVRSDVENLDLGGALDALGSLDLSDAEAAIAEIRRLAGG